MVSKACHECARKAKVLLIPTGSKSKRNINPLLSMVSIRNYTDLMCIPMQMLGPTLSGLDGSFDIGANKSCDIDSEVSETRSGQFEMMQ